MPRDIALTTIDNNYFSTSTNPALTTVDLHTTTKGAVMVETLLKIIAGTPVDAVSIIPTELIERDSV